MHKSQCVCLKPDAPDGAKYWPKGHGLMAHFLWYADEVKAVADFDNLAPEKLSAKEEQLAKKLVENLAAPFTPEEFENGYEMRMSQLIASKLDRSILQLVQASHLPPDDLRTATSY
jgi:non-homologous end joining protein Ku